VLVVLVVVLAVLLAGTGTALVTTRRQLGAARAQCRELAEQVERLETRPAGSRRRGRALRTVVETAFESASRLREGGVVGLLASSIDDLTHWLSEDRSAVDRFTAEDGTITVLFSDIENSTALNEQLGDEAWMRVLSTHDTLVQRAVETHHGHIVKSQGDGFMVVFRTPGDAVRCGIAMQDAFESGSHRALRRTPIRVRVGIHVGPVIERDGDYVGTNVAMAARVAAQADGGEILVSDEMRQALREVEDIVLVDFREAELKGLPGTHRLWEVGAV
jgi:class 3 adenylate cyclase